MILMFPPVAKPGEPPAGIAKLAGVLETENLPCTIIDANCEGLLFLLKKKYDWDDTWYKRAARKTSIHLKHLRSPEGYQNLATYKQTVKDLHRVLSAHAFSSHKFTGSVYQKGIRISLTDYKHPILSHVKSSDILKAAESPQQNPFYPYFKKRLISVIEQTGTSIVGFSLFYLNQALTTFAMIGFLKNHFPHLKIVVGGGLVTSWFKNPTWKNPFSGLVDEFIPGPGEEKILALFNKKLKPDIHYTPSYSLFPLDSYLSPSYILPYNASRGCYWKKCTFCPEKAENNSYIPIPSHIVLKDIKTICEKKNPVLIHLLDNAINMPLFKALAENPPGVSWYGYARITKQLADIDFCQALKKAGCIMLQLGLESGNGEVLEKMGKGFSPGLATRVLNSLKRAGIAVYVYLLFGTPWENRKAAQHTLDFIAKHHEKINFINTAIFNMPVCDPAHTQYETTGLYTGDLSLYTDFIHPQGWGRREVRRFLWYEFRKNRAIAHILKATPLFFNANHAPFFVMER